MISCFSFSRAATALVMRPQCKCVLLFAGYVEVAAEGLRCLTHVAPADGIGKSKLETDSRLKIRWSEAAQNAKFLGKILSSRKCAELLSGLVGIEQRNLRHAFDAAHDKDVAASGEHLFRGLSNRFESLRRSSDVL